MVIHSLCEVCISGVALIPRLFGCKTFSVFGDVNTPSGFILPAEVLVLSIRIHTFIHHPCKMPRQIEQKSKSIPT
ncbi:hypothetical protein CICLE_v10030304mg [Citrus x clementina]|uniref:Uncharacterized protein n=1 Tax=Citrus clementina TaxID=85681 RepID=V4SK81_CITCL|nr:hypothetical protein CICLE_v10030304mg [Citrus x clementina]